MADSKVILSSTSRPVRSRKLGVERRGGNIMRAGNTRPRFSSPAPERRRPCLARVEDPQRHLRWPEARTGAYGTGYTSDLSHRNAGDRMRARSKNPRRLTHERQTDDHGARNCPHRQIDDAKPQDRSTDL